MYLQILFHKSTVDKYYLFRCDFQIINEAPHLFQKNMNQTKFTSGVFREGFDSIFA